MKEIQNKTMGLSIPVQVPASVEEFDKLAGKPGVCLTAANNSVIYRTINSDLRRLLCERLEAETGIDRKVKTEHKGTEKEREVFAESEMKYYNGLIAGGHITEEQAQLYANEIAPDLVFDSAPATRAKKAPKETENLADTVIAQIADENSPTTAEGFGDKLAAKMGLESFEASFGEFDRASLVRALVALREYQSQQAQAELLA